MKTKEVLLPGIAGTTFMTLFSYIAGEIEHENFNEADLLAKLYNPIDKDASTPTSKLMGWTAHYTIGALFALVYAEFWKKNNLRPGIKHGVTLGAISGLIAIAVWKLTFTMHPAPPGINFKKYYAQLWVAHIVFGIFAAMTYKFIKDRAHQQEQERNQKNLSSVMP